jgi:hypothetical protein
MAKHTIKIKKYSDVIEEYVNGTVLPVTPGMLIEITSDNVVQPHSTEDGAALIMFALEDELQGKGIDDAYAVSTAIPIVKVPVQCWLPGHGDMAYALLADGETAVIGSWLASNGDGKLKVGTTNPIGQAVEAVDMSGSSGADPSGRIIVRIN